MDTGIGTVFLLLSTTFFVSAQEVIWVNSMDGVAIVENTENGKSLYQLRATYQGSSTGIGYGVDLEPENPRSNNPVLNDNIWMISPDGVVSLFNTGEIDKEDPKYSRGVDIHMIAYVKASPSIFSKISKTLVIIDVNDNEPLFLQKELKTSVMENVVPPAGGTLLIQGITIEDVDTQPSGSETVVTCRIVKCQKGTSQDATSCDGNFALRAQNNQYSGKRFVGDFYILKPLNYEEATVWQITLQAYDGRFRPTQDVVIDVFDIPDEPPVWIFIPTSLEHPDGTPPNSNLGRVIAEDGDGDPTKRRNISYTLVPSVAGPDLQPEDFPELYFSVDEFTGIIRNKVELDLESPPFNRHPRDYQWTINVKACEIISYDPYEVGQTLGLDCTTDGTTVVVITDVNDNAPLFNTDLYIYNITEDVRNGENLVLPSIEVFDKDSDLYNQFTVRFLVASDEFQLIQDQSNRPIIQVKNTSLIDFDPPLSRPRYNLMLIAVDNENNLLSSSASVIIFVEDANDNAPKFGQDVYEETVFEDAQGGQFVTRITATDIDTGNFGTDGIRFSFAPGGFSNLFDINSESGRVTVAVCNTPGINPCLDYEYKPNRYTFKVLAVDDLGNGPQTSYATLIINVADRNDNPPQVGNYVADIFELQRITTPPLQVIATDADENDVLTYSIAAQPIIEGVAYWQIDPNTGNLTATRPIRYQFAPKDGIFELQVAVTDGQYQALSQVIIRVIDINDNEPRFLQERYEIDLKEGERGDYYLLSVLAEDADDSTSPNGQIEYNIESGAGGQFIINKENGSIYTSSGATFDYDTQRNYTLIVYAKDKGTPSQLTGTATVIVNILDENNKNPTFVPFSRRFQVYDDQTPGTYVATLTATDPDRNAMLRFYLDANSAITPGGQRVNPDIYDYRQLFRIDNETARIYVNAPLDHNKASIVTLDSIVYDITPSLPQRGVGTVIIDILKVNKLPPVFANYSNYICIPEEQAKGTYVLSFIATDEDGAVAEFSIQDQSHDFFDISPQNGFVTIAQTVDFDKGIDDSYIVVAVTDTGTPTLSATASVSICFTNINDNYPNFTQNARYVAEIDENSPNGQYVITVSAMDRDRSDDGKGYGDVRYRVDDNRFSIDPITGVITVQKQNGTELDRELTSTLVVQVVGYDTPNGPVDVRKQRVASVIITLRDVNDNPPVYTEYRYEETIYEIIQPGTIFLTIYTTDDDLGLFGRVRYKKVPGVGNDTNNFFDISPFGQLNVTRSVQGYVGTYVFQIDATDEDGTGPFSTRANVTVHILPAGNTAPYFVRPPRDNDTIEVLEEQYFGMFIYDVSARDVDTGVNGIVDYMFYDGGEETQTTDAFEINPTTGVIRAKIIFDRETDPKYVLLLKVKDRGETRLEATRFLTVTIIDVNDNKPYFKEEQLDLRVREDAPVGTEVKDDGNRKIEAFDPDEFPIIKYRIISGNEDNAFVLDEDTAKLYTNKVLDTEVKSIYDLDVQAYNPEPDYTVIRERRAVDPSILRVRVLVGDINDEAPTFLGEPYYGCVSTRDSFDKLILTVSAVDYDATSGGVVRYRLMNEYFNENGQPIFGIHESFGIISNKVLMRDYTERTYYLTVNARDQENIAEAEAINTTATIYVTQPGQEAKLLITQNTAEVRLYQNQIQRIIEASNISNADWPDWRFHRLCINTIRDHVINTAGATSPVWSDVYISGIVVHKTSGVTRIATARELKDIIESEMNKRPTDFNNLYIKTVEAESSEETSVKRSFVLIVLIIIAVLIFLVILFIILAYLCIRAAKQQKKARLIQRTQAPAPVPVIIEKPLEPAAVFEAPEPVAYDNRAYVVEQQGPPPAQEQYSVEPEPVHVQYAVVQKRPESFEPQIVRAPTPEPVDTEDVIIVSQFRDEPPQRGEEEEFRIVTEPM